MNAARLKQRERFAGTEIACNACIPAGKLSEYCPLSNEAQVLMKNAFERLGLSARSYDRLLKVARTIAIWKILAYRGRPRGGSSAIPGTGSEILGRGPLRQLPAENLPKGGIPYDDSRRGCPLFRLCFTVCRRRPCLPEYAIRVLLRYAAGTGAGHTLPGWVIDLGCGCRTVHDPWRGHSRRVIGVEPNPDMLAEARDMPPRLTFHQASAGSLAFREADIVVCAQSFHWMDPEAALRGSGPFAQARRGFCHRGL